MGGVDGDRSLEFGRRYANLTEIFSRRHAEGELLRSSGNNLYFDGDQRGTPLPVIAALHNLIHKQGYSEVVLDFQYAGYLSPAFVLPIVSACRAYRRERVGFEIVMPGDRKSANLFSNANWAHLISPEHFESKSENNIKHLSATQFLTAEDHHSAVDRSIGILLEVAEGLDRSRIKALEWSLNEITDNVLNHAESHIGGLMQVVTYSKKVS